MVPERSGMKNTSWLHPRISEGLDAFPGWGKDVSLLIICVWHSAIPALAASRVAEKTSSVR